MFSFDPAQERRSGSYPRVPCQREVALSGVSDHDVMSGQLCDLGPGGVAVRSPGALPAGASLRCSFADPESGTSIQLSCQVAWCAAPEAEGEEGTFGLRFVDVAPPAAAALHALLAAEQRAPQPVWRPGQAVHVQVEGAEHAERLAVSHSDAESLVLEKALTGASLGAAATLAAVGEGAVETEQGRVSAVSLRMHHELPVLQLRVERSAPEPARTVDWSVPPHMADAGWAEAPAAAETPLPLADTVRPSDWPAPASLSMPTDIDEDAPTPALSAPRGTVAPLPWRGDDAAAPVAQDDTDGPVTVPDPIQLVPAAAVLQEMDSPDAVTPSPWPRRLARLQAQLHGVGQRWQQGVAAVAGGWARLWAALVLMGLRLRAWGRALGRQMWLRLAALRRPAALRGARTVTRSASPSAAARADSS
ncbi:MAG: PilZ domain-containing protein, partial [Polyangiales bacterium]